MGSYEDGMDEAAAPSLIRLANLSVLDHSPHLDRYAAQGFEVQGPPGGLVVPTGLLPNQVRELAEEKVRGVAEAGYDGAMVGGRADIVCYLRDALATAGLLCFVADTGRVLDREGYFVLLPVGLIEVLQPSGFNK